MQVSLSIRGLQSSNINVQLGSHQLTNVQQLTILDVVYNIQRLVLVESLTPGPGQKFYPVRELSDDSVIA